MHNMTQKSDYQLRWIVGNEASYPEKEVIAANTELKRRDNAIITKAGFMDYFKNVWNTIKDAFGFN